MAKLICKLIGVYGREMELYDTKIVINTKVTVGSVLTNNFADGEKTIFLCDIVGVQFKKSGRLIGYLQFELPSMQMNNKESNVFSENTFTFEAGKNNITNEMMEEVYHYIVDRLEEVKYGTHIIENPPSFEKKFKQKEEEKAKYDWTKKISKQTSHDRLKYCPYCGETVKSNKCEMCGKEVNY